MAEGTKVYYWRGWITPETMQEAPNWFEEYLEGAKKTEAEGYQLVVFQIPKVSRLSRPEADWDMIERIELLLQEVYGIPPQYKKE